MDKQSAIIFKILRNATHDIKNLLSPVFLYSEMVEETPNSEQNRENAKMVLMKAEEINRYLDAVRLLYHEGSWYEEGPFSLLAQKVVLLMETAFKSNEKTLFIRYSSGMRFYGGDFSNGGFSLLAGLMFAAEDRNDLTHKGVWLVTRRESDKLVWRIYFGAAGSRQKIPEQIMELSEEEILRLEASLGEPFAAIGAKPCSM